MLRNHREDIAHCVGREKKIKVGYSESYKQTLMGLFMTISYLAFLLKPIILLLYQSEPVSVVPTIVSMKKPLLLQKTNTLRLDSELLEQVVLCGHSPHIRGHILTLRGHLPHH